MPSISTIGDGVQTTYYLPIHSGAVTATVNAVSAPITSQDPTKVVLTTAPAADSAVLITYTSAAGQNVIGSSLPKDSSGGSIQALAPDATANVAIGVATARVLLPTGSQIIRVAANAKCFFKMGDVTVVATGSDTMFPVGAELFVVPVGATYIAVIQDGAVTGSLNVTKMV